jgi:hypothetical protein
MFKDFGHRKIDPKDRAVRVFSLVVSGIVLVLIIYVVLLLANLIPTSESREYESRIRRGQEILEILEPFVVEAGFVKKPTSAGHDIYMPQMIIQLSNGSEKHFSQITLECRFRKGDQEICGGRSYANDLEPGETRRVTIKCVESMFTGAVIYGVGLEDAKKGLEYRLKLITEKTNVSALSGRLEFDVL